MVLRVEIEIEIEIGWVGIAFACQTTFDVKRPRKTSDPC